MIELSTTLKFGGKTELLITFDNYQDYNRISKLIKDEKLKIDNEKLNGGETK